MGAAVIGALQALNELYSGSSACATLRHWRPRFQVRTASSFRDPLLPSSFHGARVAVDVSEPFLVVGSHKAGGQWTARRIVRASSDAAAPLPGKEPAAAGATFWQKLAQARGPAAPPPRLSDIFWPSAGAFLAMAFFSFVDDILAARGLKFTMASFGAVCALLFITPKSPASQKYTVLVTHLACAMLGVAALATFGPSLLARSLAVAGSIAFMQFTGSFHPPAAAIPLIFIDNPKFHQLTWWYILFPGAAGCFFLFLLQEGVLYLKENWKFG